MERRQQVITIKMEGLTNILEKLIATVINYYITQKIDLSVKDIEFLSDKIVERFPNEEKVFIQNCIGKSF